MTLSQVPRELAQRLIAETDNFGDCSHDAAIAQAEAVIREAMQKAFEITTKHSSENRYECNSCGALYGDNQTVGCPHNSKAASIRPQSAEQLIKTHAAMIVQRVAELPDYCSPEERPNEMTCTDIELMHIAETQLYEFAEAYASAAAAESRKHNWKCVAPENGYYRWQCQNPGCSETAPYPSVLPDGSCAYSAALPVGESPAAAPAAPLPQRHGIDCEKMPHTGTGYLHAPEDDTSYDVDGVNYCGRCHQAI